MLTVQQLQPTVTNVDELLKTGQPVGYGRGSYIKSLLEELGFDASKIKPYDTTEDYHNALSKGSKNGGVAALVDEIPYIKLFLAEHCKGYTMVGPIYKTAGFGYALRKGSPLVGDISQAILNITGGDTIIQIEKKWIGDQNNCQNVGTISGTDSLIFDSFAEPIIATGVASTTSLVIALITYFGPSGWMFQQPQWPIGALLVQLFSSGDISASKIQRLPDGLRTNERTVGSADLVR